MPAEAPYTCRTVISPHLRTYDAGCSVSCSFIGGVHVQIRFVVQKKSVPLSEAVAGPAFRVAQVPESESELYTKRLC